MAPVVAIFGRENIFLAYTKNSHMITAWSYNKMADSKTIFKAFQHFKTNFKADLSGKLYGKLCEHLAF